jgi:hypothetical protein
VILRQKQYMRKFSKIDGIFLELLTMFFCQVDSEEKAAASFNRC